MHERTFTVDLWNLSLKVPGFIRKIRVAFAAVMPVICLLSMALQTHKSAGSRESLRRLLRQRPARPVDLFPWRKPWGSTSFRDRPRRS